MSLWLVTSLHSAPSFAHEVLNCGYQLVHCRMYLDVQLKEPILHPLIWRKIEKNEELLQLLMVAIFLSIRHYIQANFLLHY
jgi:hypothetical protein